MTLTSIMLVTGLSIAASGIGFVLQILLAARYGAGLPIDSYLFSISVPLFLAALGSAALSYSLVPALVEVELDHVARAMLLRQLRARVGLIAVCFVAFGFPALWFQRLSLPATSVLRDAPMLSSLIILGWCIGGIQIFTSLFTIELNAARRPITAACLALPPNLIAILSVLLGPPRITTVPAGVLCGTIFSLIAGVLLTRGAFFSKHGKARPAASAVRLAKIGWTLLAMSCFSIYAVVDAFWGPRAGVGTLASLGYAQRLIVGIGSLVVAGPSAVLTPRFAIRLRDGGRSAFLREVARTMVLIGVITACAAAILMVLATPLIKIAFGRGAFLEADIIRVTQIFRAMLPGFCAMLISVVLTRAIFCLKSIERAMAFTSIIWAMIYFASCGIMLSWGSIGFGISYSLAWISYLVIALFILYRYAPRHELFLRSDAIQRKSFS
ncbi:lipid II flippase MurJ [Sphingomonas yabuuchiae]|uniref:lipid II flippase MurJ n=1 Tax=Sphingomonas yabuuchiae TaxID=172044 RepID=UPI003D9637EF